MKSVKGKYSRIEARRTREGIQFYTGIEVYKTEAGYDPNQLSDLLYLSRQQGSSGPFAPICFKAVIDDVAFGDGEAKVTALFRTQGGRTARRVGRATIEIDFVARSRAVIKDLDNNVIIGPHSLATDATEIETAAEGINIWKIIRGSNVVNDGRAIIRMRTAYERGGLSSNQIGAIMHLQGTVNSHTMENFGGFTRGQLKLLSSPHTKQWNQDGLWYVNYAFEVSPIFPQTWNEWTVKQLFARITTRVPMFQADATKPSGLSAIENATRTIQSDVPYRILAGAGNTYVLNQTKTQPASTRLYEESDFGDLDAMVLWSEE